MLVLKLKNLKFNWVVLLTNHNVNRKIISKYKYQKKDRNNEVNQIEMRRREKTDSRQYL